jgi:flavin-dependent dehydrogenase
VHEIVDVVIVGARCAGAPLAMLLARTGRRVLVLERGRIGSDKISTLYIQPPGVAHLQAWGLLDAVRATGAPELRTVTYEMSGTRISGEARWPDSMPRAYAPRRTRLDPLLAEAAVAAGADLRERSGVTGLLQDGSGRVTGVRYTTAGADGRRKECTVQAHLVVGADGMRSTVAELVGAPTTVSDPTLTCAYYTFWHGLHAGFEMYEGETGWVSSVPTSDGLVLVSAYHPQEEFDRVRHAADASYRAGIAANSPGLAERMRGATQAAPLTGFGDQRNFFRQASGPGWVLVGDAGHHKDSLPARGIGDAFLQVQLLVHHLQNCDAGDDQDRALVAFGEDRDRLLTDSYRATLLVASAQSRPQRRALLATVAADPVLTQRYFDTVAGLAPVSELYTPDLLRGLVA